jgi:hypothetical protein
MEKDRNSKHGKARIFTKAEIDAYIRNKEKEGNPKLLKMDEDIERKVHHFISRFTDLIKWQMRVKVPDTGLPNYMTPIFTA